MAATVKEGAPLSAAEERDGMTQSWSVYLAVQADEPASMGTTDLIDERLDGEFSATVGPRTRGGFEMNAAVDAPNWHEAIDRLWDATRKAMVEACIDGDITAVEVKPW